MMPEFADADAGSLGREWWRRCQPRTGQALAIGMLVGLLAVGGLAAGRLQPVTLILWAKYQAARGASVVGLSSVKIVWLNEQGVLLTTVDALLKTPGLDVWAQSVSNQIAATIPLALLSGLLASLATFLWSMREPPGPINGNAPEPVAAAPLEPPPVAAKPEPHPVTVVEEKPLPVILPRIPPPVTLPHLTNQNESRSQDNSRPAPPSDPPAPVVQPHPSPSVTPPGKSTFSYEAYWGLTELPFENVPDPKFYFPTPMHEEALHRLLYGVQTRKGAVMLTGEVGCGKTLLSRELSLHLSGQQYDVAVIANPGLSTEEFLSEVLYQLGLEPSGTKVTLLHLLNERLMDNYKRGRQTVVVIDEAQTIPSDQIFEELRLLLNFQLNDRFLMTLVLMGQPELNDRVSAIKQFAQRISIKYHLGYFSAEQTVQYIEFRLKAARCSKPIFTAEALDAICKQSGGVPRNINTLCDLCLLIGYMDRATGIDRTIVERASAERGELGLF